MGLPLETALEQVELLAPRLCPSYARRWRRAVSRACLTRRPTPLGAEVRRRRAPPAYAEPNRGDNLTGTSPYQDSDPDAVADLPLGS
jgi:hypothetical protein